MYLAREVDQSVNVSPESAPIFWLTREKTEMVSKLYPSRITIKILKLSEGGEYTVGLLQARASLQNPHWVTSRCSSPLCDLFRGCSLLGHTINHKRGFPLSQESLNSGTSSAYLVQRLLQTWHLKPSVLGFFWKPLRFRNTNHQCT